MQYKKHCIFSISAWGEQPYILKFTSICVYVSVYVFFCLCHVSWPNEKWYRPMATSDLKLGTHTLPASHWPYLKRGFFIKSPWRPLASKNCRVTWIFRISPRLPCYTFCHTFPQKILIFSYVKPRFFALKFVFLNEITKVKLFWSKWRYVYPQCILKQFSPKQISCARYQKGPSPLFSKMVLFEKTNQMD